MEPNCVSEKTLVEQSLGLTGGYSRQRSHSPLWEEFFQGFQVQQFVESRKLHERSYYIDMRQNNDTTILSNFDHTLRNILDRINYPLAMKRSLSGIEPFGFTMILGLGWFSHCLSDFRDSIFGFLGLADGVIADEIEPDYSISAACAFKNTAVKITIYLGSLLLFSLTDYTAGRTISVPIWVPDWEKLGPRSEDQFKWSSKLNRASNECLCSACPGRSRTFEVPENASVRLSGLHFDRVAQKSSAFMLPDLVHGGRTHLRECIRKWRQFCYQSTTIDRDSIDEHFNRLLTNDIFSFRESDGGIFARRCSRSELDMYKGCLNELGVKNGTSTGWQHLDELLEQLTTACIGRHLFLTKSGYDGLGPAELQVGDLIYALAGGGGGTFPLYPTTSAGCSASTDLQPHRRLLRARHHGRRSCLWSTG